MIKKLFILLSCLAGLIILLALGFYLTSRGNYIVLKTTDQNPSLPSIVLGGVTFHAETFGDENSPLVVVIHGGPGNDYRYLLNIQVLADTYLVVFYDQRGTGLSPRVKKDKISLDFMISDVDKIIRHYGKGKPVRIIGHSWGGMLAAAYVGQYPKMASHIVLAEPGPLTTESARAFMSKFEMNFGLKSIKDLGWLWFQSRHVEDPSGQGKDDYFFSQLVTLDSDDNPMKGYFCNGRPPKGTLKIWRYSFASSMQLQNEGMSDLDNNPLNLVKGVENYKGRTLFLASSCNSIIGEDHQRKFHLKYFSGAEFKVVKGSGHNMFSERPAQSLKLVRKFLAK